MASHGAEPEDSGCQMRDTFACEMGSEKSWPVWTECCCQLRQDRKAHDTKEMGSVRTNR